eukprot:4175065-Prymnesium_polylepis.1
MLGGEERVMITEVRAALLQSPRAARGTPSATRWRRRPGMGVHLLEGLPPLPLPLPLTDPTACACARVLGAQLLEDEPLELTLPNAPKEKKEKKSKPSKKEPGKPQRCRCDRSCAATCPARLAHTRQTKTSNTRRRARPCDCRGVQALFGSRLLTARACPPRPSPFGSGCLKRYCVCFAAGNMCSADCKCK